MIDLELTNDNTQEFENSINREMQKAVNHFEQELTTIRTGRAHPALVEDVEVSCYGDSTMRLKELASIAIPEARFITITPWDNTVLKDIEKAIAQSDLGINPTNDGTTIRIALPEMSNERRIELAKVLNKKLEDARISIRNIRKIHLNLVRDSLKAKKISEDHEKRLNDTLQKRTDFFIKICDERATAKEKEIKTI